MAETNSLVIFTKAALMLAEADTIQKAKELKNLALTAADWARRKGMGEEAIRYARSYAMEAERKMGEMLADTERASAGRPSKISTPEEPIKSNPTLAELGLSKKESSRAQFMAAMTREKFDDIKDGKKTITETRREEKRGEIMAETPPLPNEKYRVIYADPPWKYGDQLTEDYGATKFHYPAMTVSELCALPIVELAEDNAVLFLWVTSPLLSECWPIIKAWGFEYKSSFVWDKIKHNFGHYNSVRHEFLLICTRGSCLPDESKLIDSVQPIERTGEHSEKPKEFRKIIDMLYPKGKRMELFARKEAAGWETWGNELS